MVHDSRPTSPARRIPATLTNPEPRTPLAVVDPNQRSSSLPAPVFLRAYAFNAAAIRPGQLITNRYMGDGTWHADYWKSAPATCAVVKAQARDLLGIEPRIPSVHCSAARKSLWQFPQGTTASQV